MDSDEEHDREAEDYLQLLQRVGPHSKKILNYSYPPLLYQRGEVEDDSDEYADEEDPSHMMTDCGQLPELNDSDDVDLIDLEG